MSTRENVFCSFCNEDVPHHLYHGHLRSNRHKDNSRQQDDDIHVEILRTAFKTRLSCYRISSPNHHIILRGFLSELKNKVLAIISRDLAKFLSVKLNFEMFGYYVLQSQDTHDVKSFNSKNVVVTVSTDLHQLYENFSVILDEKASEFQERGSGKLIKILRKKLH